MAAIEKSSNDLIETDVDDETIIVALESGQLYSVTDTAAAVWRLIDGKNDRAMIIAALAEEYQTAPATIESDVDAFLKDAAETGLIRQIS
jgi:hypothetical protein